MLVATEDEAAAYADDAITHRLLRVPVLQHPERYAHDLCVKGVVGLVSDSSEGGDSGGARVAGPVLQLVLHRLHPSAISTFLSEYFTFVRVKQVCSSKEPTHSTSSSHFLNRDKAFTALCLTCIH